MQPFIKVTWIDASDPIDGTWFEESEVVDFGSPEQDTVVVSFGYVVTRNERYIVLAADVTYVKPKQPVYGRPTKIPVGTILKEEVINVGG